MKRCLDLATLGVGHVAPNPMVGAVLVYNEKIIGEGFHRRFGGPHAEVNCLASVKPEDWDKIDKSVLYVSLEPCSHYGKTPPCTDLIIKNKIPEVIIGVKDPNPNVNGKGIEILRASGIKVETGVSEKRSMDLNKRFFVSQKNHRPYIILKWAETADRKIAGESGERLFISNENTNRLVHKWRTEECSIMVGTRTAMLDNPELTSRYWTGLNPVRLVVDMDLFIPNDYRVFNHSAPTIIFNTVKHSDEKDWSLIHIRNGNDPAGIYYYQVSADVNLVHQVANALYQMKIQSVIVEGGARLLQSFIDENLWDEARVIRNKGLKVDSGLAAPDLHIKDPTEQIKVGSDMISFFINKQNI